MTTDLTEFIAAVSRNCDISDSRSVGLYSICGLALRLRDLYKWEKRLPPWVEKDSSQILGWIEEKETLWETLAEEEFEPLPLSGQRHDPFETKAINQIIQDKGLYYGAGYAQSLKPTFFIAAVSQVRVVENVATITLERELVRDLLTIPALHQDNHVLLRKDSARLFLWDQMAYLKKSGRPALEFALRHCGVPDARPATLKHHLESILNIQIESYLYHEIGELKEKGFDRQTWRGIISAFPHSAIELLARVTKDLLADTHPSGTLGHIIRTRNRSALGFYVAFIDGLLKALFIDLKSAFDRFVSTSDWAVIEDVRQKGFSKAGRYADTLMTIYREGRDKSDMEWAARRIDTTLIQPLLNTDKTSSLSRQREKGESV